MSFNAHPTRDSRTAFAAEDVAEFLESGWWLALDADRLVVGWGAWSPSSPDDPCALFTPGFYLESKTDSAQAWRRTQHWDLVERERFTRLVMTAVAENVNAKASTKNERFQWLEPDFASFEQQWSAIREGMKARSLRKAVPIVFGSSRGVVGRDRRLAMIRSLIAQPRQLYPYGFWSETEGLIGATPEILFSQLSGSKIESVALAGTRGKSDGVESARLLLTDAKERYEHQLVIEDLKERFSLVGDVAIGSTEAAEYPTLYHLRTRVQAQPRETARFEALVELLHPTPALGVSPRALGFDEIRRWDEAAARSRYGAPFGASFVDGDTRRQHCVVAIRNIEWKGDQIRLGSGAGVVEESVLEREWAELKLKRDSVKRMLDL